MQRHKLLRAWNGLTIAKATQEYVGESNDVFFSVLCLIAHKPSITIAGIVKHPHFKDNSLSTIKRAVKSLVDDGLVDVTMFDGDKREKCLYVTGEE
jgi:DNA-binding MarR family transcriptional regulator